MPVEEINAAIIKLESQLKHFENLLDHSISNGVILSKTKIILRELKQVSQKLNELKRLKETN
jgi:hypothetical protein